MIQKLEAYLKDHPEPKWVHLRRKVSETELEMEGPTGKMLLTLALVGTVGFGGLIYILVRYYMDQHVLPISMIAIIGLFVLMWVFLMIYLYRRALEKVIMRVGNQSDLFTLCHRSTSLKEDAPIAFDPNQLVTTTRRFTNRYGSTRWIFEIYTSKESQEKGINPLTLRPEGECFLIENWDQERGEQFFALLNALKEDGAQAEDPI